MPGPSCCFSADDRWPDGQSASAFYLHTLVTDPYVKGSDGNFAPGGGSACPSAAEYNLCGWICSIYSVFLNHYYESAGFHLAGRCKEGPYEGNLREKALF